MRGAAHGLAQFITTVAESGLSQALAEAGLTSLDGKNATEIASGVVTALCGPNSTIDQVDMHAAMRSTMDKLLENANEFQTCELALKAAAPNIGETLTLFFGNYIYERFCSVSYANLLVKLGAERLESSMRDIKDYILGKVAAMSVKSSIASVNWKGTEGANLVTQVLQETERVFCS